MPRGKKQFALIWWVVSKKSDVIPLASIPKTQRNVDALATLTWEDFQTKKKSKEQAKVIAISSDENELHQEIVTTSGTLHDMQHKIFSPDVLTNQKHMTEGKNVMKHIQRSSKKKIEREIGNDLPISYQSVPKQSSITRSSVPKTSTHTSTTGTLVWPNETNQNETATPTATNPQLDRPQYSETLSSSHCNQSISPRTVDYVTSSWPRSQYITATATNLQPDRPQYSQTQALLHHDHHIFPRTVDYPISSQPQSQYTTATPTATLTATNPQLDQLQYSQTAPPSHHDHSISLRTLDYPTPSQTQRKYTTATPTATNPQLDQLQYSQTAPPSHHDHSTPLRTLDYPTPSQTQRKYTTATPTATPTATNPQLDRLQYSQTSPASQHNHRFSNVLPVLHYPNPRSVSPDLNVTSDSANSSPSRTQDTLLPDSPPALIEPQLNTISGSYSNKEGVSSDSESYDGGCGLFSRIACGEVTERDIFFQTQLLKAMKKAHDSQTKRNVNSMGTISIPPHYLEDGVEKVEISPNCGFYLDKSKATYLELKMKMDDDWKVLVRETLLEVYGMSISNYSATGKRGSRPGIDIQLFQGLYEWVNRVSTELVDKKVFIEFINKIASNKRKYRKPSKPEPPNKKIKSQPKTTKMNQKPEHQVNKSQQRSGSSSNGSVPVSRDNMQREREIHSVILDFPAPLEKHVPQEQKREQDCENDGYTLTPI